MNRESKRIFCNGIQNRADMDRNTLDSNTHTGTPLTFIVYTEQCSRLKYLV